MVFNAAFNSISVTYCSFIYIEFPYFLLNFFKVDCCYRRFKVELRVLLVSFILALIVFLSPKPCVPRREAITTILKKVFSLTPPVIEPGSLVPDNKNNKNNKNNTETVTNVHCWLTRLLPFYIYYNRVRDTSDRLVISQEWNKSLYLFYTFLSNFNARICEICTGSHAHKIQ